MIQNTLERLVRDYPEVTGNRRKLNALLRDYFHDDRRSCNLLLIAYDEAIPDQLVKAGKLDSFILFRYRKNLENTYGISAEWAEKAVLAWAYALGVAVQNAGQDMENKDSLNPGAKDTLSGSGAVSPVYGIDGLMENDDIPDRETLTDITFPDDRKSIGAYAFENCEVLENVTFPAGLESIGDAAFYGCAVKNLTFPEGLSHIGYNAFGHCAALVSIAFLGGLKSIGAGAFGYCEKLESVKLNHGLEIIGDGVFLFAKALKEVTFPDTLRVIGVKAFCGCKALPYISLPNGLQRVDEKAFEGCEALENVRLPKGLKSIGDYAFRGCGKLERITVPDSVRSIGVNAFGDMIIYCNEGSYAARYAQLNGMDVITKG